MDSVEKLLRNFHNINIREYELDKRSKFISLDNCEIILTLLIACYNSIHFDQRIRGNIIPI